MATFREYYLSDFPSSLSHQVEWTLATADGGETANVTVRVHADFSAGVRYVSYFISEAQNRDWLLLALVTSATRALEQAAGSVSVRSDHASGSEVPESMDELPFSGRVFIYVDASIGDRERARSHEEAGRHGVRLQIRDRSYFQFLIAAETPRAFISHDSRDKDSLVRPLVDKLRSMLCPVWYDEYSLSVGDSLTQSIDRGLAACPRCVVVLSPAFLSNAGWTRGELNAIVTRHMSEGGGVILPIWHGVTRAEVAAFSPLLADVVALDASLPLDELARRLMIALQPSA